MWRYFGLNFACWQVTSNVDGKPTVYFPAMESAKRKVFSNVVTAVFIVIVCIVVFAIFGLKTTMQCKRQTSNNIYQKNTLTHFVLQAVFFCLLKLWSQLIIFCSNVVIGIEQKLARFSFLPFCASLIFFANSLFLFSAPNSPFLQPSHIAHASRCFRLSTLSSAASFRPCCSRSPLPSFQVFGRSWAWS